MTRKTITRRQLLRRSAAAIVASGALTFGYTWRIEPHWVQIVRRTLPIEQLPDTLLGKTLIQISDLHIGPVVDDDYMAAALRKVSSLNADILAITGDFMTCRGSEQLDHTMRILDANLRPAKLATIGILGNHDYSASWQDDVVANRLTRRLNDSGVRMLRNQLLDIGGLQVVGVDEFWSDNFNPRVPIDQLDPARAKLALCHNPDGMDLPGAWTGYQGWILAGHTHGGQCKPPFFDPPVTPVKNKRYTSGEFDLFDGRRLYINRGLGYLHRVRFNARPEITVFELTRAT
jgi:predicted MPP superfamily phosphohydrolase